MKKIIKLFFIISAFLYFIILIYILFARKINYWEDLSMIDYIKYSSNIIPFKTISKYIKYIFNGNINTDISVKNLVVNFIIFLPMGIYIPYFIRKINKYTYYIITIFIIILTLEITQVISRKGSFDIDDIILNLTGAIIGFRIYKMKIIQNYLNKY